MNWRKNEIHRRDARKGPACATGLGPNALTESERKVFEKVLTHSTGIAKGPLKCTVCGLGSPTVICYGCRAKGHK